MGGHAFKGLYCPRISSAMYDTVKAQATAVLQTIFAHVVVPTEMPCKDDYGDVDLLVCSPLHSPNGTHADKFDWKDTVGRIKEAFNTMHGRRGFLNPDCMYFAIDAPYGEEHYFIQIDVKVCFKPELFAWQTFELNYASNSKMIGSMVKPLGLTIDPEGFHIRLEEMEETNFPGSMLWIGKNPKDLLRIVGLDRRIMNAGFKTKDEIYEFFASSWLFNPSHFSARLAEEKYSDRLDDRSPHWTYFIREWLPQNYPGYRFVDEITRSVKPIDFDSYLAEEDLQAWYKRTRAAVREKVFTMFPHVASEYYSKRAVFTKELEEQKLRKLLREAIPSGDDGWKEDFPQPRIILKQQEPQTPNLKPTVVGELTPPATPATSEDGSIIEELMLPSFHRGRLEDVPLYLNPFPRSPPTTCTPRPPPAQMSLEAKLTCIARWTLFDHSTGTPYLLTSPRDKDFEMHWTDVIYAGATEEVLVTWAKEMWWHIWIRQSHVNYVGMWKKRFEKDDKKAEKMKAEADSKTKAEGLFEAERVKVMGRLEALNVRMQ